MRLRFSLLATAVLFTANSAAAQQKQQVSFTNSPENSKYTQQLTINVGDIPNHVVRVFEIHYTFPNNAPVINGLKVVESWDRGFGDRIEGNGSLTLYTEFVMDNGDKFFTRIVGIVQNTAGKLTSTNVGNIIFGTGKLAGIQGNIRSSGSFNYNTGVSEPQVEIEYWIGK
jgi:hypothetical protein